MGQKFILSDILPFPCCLKLAFESRRGIWYFLVVTKWVMTFIHWPSSVLWTEDLWNAICPIPVHSAVPCGEGTKQTKSCVYSLWFLYCRISVRLYQYNVVSDTIIRDQCWFYIIKYNESILINININLYPDKTWDAIWNLCVLFFFFLEPWDSIKFH